MSLVHRLAHSLRWICFLAFMVWGLEACAPTTDVDSPPQVTLAITDTPVAVIVIPTPDSQVVAVRTPELTPTPKSIVVRSINAPVDEKSVSSVRQNYRPIPTVNADTLNSSQNVFAATTQPRSAEITLSTMTRSDLTAQIELARNEIRNVAFVLEASRDTSAVDCQQITRSYGRIFEDIQPADVPEQLTVPHESYDLAVNMFAVELLDLDAACRTFAEDLNLQVSHILVDSFDPPNLIADAMENAALALTHIYDAQLWLNADESKTHALYTTLHEAVTVYAEFVEFATVADCEALSKQFQSIQASVRPLSPPVGYRRVAYSQYQEAVDAIERGGTPLIESCQQFAEVPLAERPTELSAELVTSALDAFQIALANLNTALTVQPDAPQATPVNTPRAAAPVIPTTPAGGDASQSPITARFVRVQPTNATHLYEVVLQVQIRSSHSASRVFIGGFNMDPQTNQLIVTVQCDREFQDRVVMIDNSGTVYTSNVVTASRGDACPRYGTNNWPTATPHPTLTVKPQPTKFPTKTPPPTFTPWTTTQP